jgi:hypothetical protein
MAAMQNALQGPPDVLPEPFAIVTIFQRLGGPAIFARLRQLCGAQKCWIFAQTATR